MNSPAQDRHNRSPIDHAVLTALREDVGDEVLRSFIRTYIDLLIIRLAHIDRAMGRRDSADALQEVPDLRTSSAMLGAMRLTELAEALEHFLRRGRIAAAAGLLPGVRAEAAAVVIALRALDGDSTDLQPPNL
jgi:HPt (histidine-containing phosphotransfer) domain-containing protein